MSLMQDFRDGTAFVRQRRRPKYHWGLLCWSYLLAGLGGWAIWAHANPWVAIGVCVLIWSHDAYKKSERDNGDGKHG